MNAEQEELEQPQGSSSFEETVYDFAGLALPRLLLEADTTVLRGPTSRDPLSSCSQNNERAAYFGRDTSRAHSSTDIPQQALERWLDTALISSLLDSVQPLENTALPDCDISPSIASLVSIDAMHCVVTLCGQLPCRIRPCEHETALPAYTIELPENSTHSTFSTLNVLVSWPDQLSAPGEDTGDIELTCDPSHYARLRIQDEFPSCNVRTHLLNTLQLIDMGLTSHPQARGRQQADVQSIEHLLALAKLEIRDRQRHLETLDVLLREEKIRDHSKESMRTFYSSIGIDDSEEFVQAGAYLRRERLRQRDLLASVRARVVGIRESLADKAASSRPYQSLVSASCSGLISLQCAAPIFFAGPSSTESTLPIFSPTSRPCKPSFDYGRLWNQLAGATRIKSPILLSHNPPTTDDAISDNVPLFLQHSHDELNESFTRFQPSLLQARFERWMLSNASRSDQRVLPPGLGILTEAEDLLLLGAESDFIRSDNLHVELYKNLCRKHALHRDADSHHAYSSKGSISVIPSCSLANIAGPESAQQVTIDSEGDKNIDILEALCTLGDTRGAGTTSEERATDPVMYLSTMLAWTTSKPDAIFREWSDEGHFAFPSIHTDFVIEEPLHGPQPLRSMLSEGNTNLVSDSETTLTGTLKDMWHKLDNSQQHYMMSSLIRLLQMVWNSFDFLGESELDRVFNERDSRHTGDTTHGAHTALHQEQIHRLTQMHAADFVWGGTDMDSTTSSSESESASCKNTSDIQLRQLEENFMRQSFLEAFEAATMSRHRNVSKPPPSVTTTDESIRKATTDDAPKEFDRCIYGPDGGRVSAPFMSAAQGSQYRPFQLMTTTRAMAQESVCAQVNTCILPLCTSDERERGWMRQLDFSLDDLLVQVVSGQEISENSESTSLRPRIVGVSRWKKFAPVMAVPETSATYVPRSCNTFQVAARASPYPLIHLFSFPDISFPPKLGDEEILTEGQASKTCGLANSLAQLLALKNPRVAEFLTCTLAEKEIILYHRWMAAWHERSPFAPEATRRRLDIMVAARRYKSQEAARRLARFHERAGRRILNPSESDALRRSSLDLQTVQCPRCMEDIAGNEMVAADMAYFEESIRFLDEALCASPHEEQAQGRGDEGGHDGSLGMSTRDPQMARTLPLARTTELQAARGTVDEPWLRLSKEEQALIRRQLFQGN